MQMTLRPMTAEEFTRFETALWESYTAERRRNLGTSEEDERADVARQRSQLLPEGQQTPDHFFWHTIAPDGHSVGALWVHIREAKREAFIYDIEVDPPEQHKGYGRQILDALEVFLRPRGITSISLNVFGDNAVANRLYLHAGYKVAATLMRKDM